MAQTPWGDLRMNDAHVHFFSHGFYASLARERNLGGAGDLAQVLNWEIPSPGNPGAVERWVAEFDRFGVSRAALIASVHSDEAAVAAAVGRYPQRFFGYFMLDPLQADAVDRAKSAFTDPFLHCLCLFPAMHGFSIADPRLTPLFQLASENRFSIFVHCGALTLGVRKKLGLPSRFDMRFSNPLDLHAIALRFPRIRFVVPHFGAGLFREALMLADMCPNVYLDTSSSNRWMLYEGLDLRTVLKRALDVAGPERLIFGTDSSFFPRGWQSGVSQEQATALYELGLDKKQAEQIFALNLERMHEPRTAYLKRISD